MERLGARNISDQPISNALVKLTAESSKSSSPCPSKPGAGAACSRAGPARAEETVLARRASLTREIFAGILVVGMVAIVLGYGRLARGPFLSRGSFLHRGRPSIATYRLSRQDRRCHPPRAPDGPGMLFRLRNIRLVEQDGSILAQAPLAAIGMSGSALLSGRLAPGSVDFIGPRFSCPQGRPGPLVELLACRPRAEPAPGRLRGNGRAGGETCTPEPVTRQAPSRASGGGQVST